MNRSHIGQFRYLSMPLTLGSATLALATWACFGLGLGSATTTCVYLLTIVLLSLMDFVSSVIFSIIAVGCLDFFFQTPLFDFGVENAQDLTTLFVFLITSIVITSLVRRLRRFEQVHRDQTPLLDLTRDLVLLREPERIPGDNRRERARRAFEGRLYRQMMGLPRDPRRKLLVALFTEHGYLPRFIRRRLRLPAPIDTHDRRVLEQIIIPGYLAD